METPTEEQIVTLANTLRARAASGPAHLSSVEAALFVKCLRAKGATRRARDVEQRAGASGLTVSTFELHKYAALLLDEPAAPGDAPNAEDYTALLAELDRARARSDALQANMQQLVDAKVVAQQKLGEVQAELDRVEGERNQLFGKNEDLEAELAALKGKAKTVPSDDVVTPVPDEGHLSDPNS